MIHERTSTPLFGMQIPGKFSVHHGVKFKENGNSFTMVKCEGHYQDYLDFMQSAPEATGGYNADQFNDHYQNDDGGTDWKGGTYHQMFHEPADLSVYNDVRKKLSTSKVWREITHKFNDASTRKRVKNAYDGEYDHDKRWDTEPFSKREQRKSITRIVKLRVESGFSAFVEARKIAEFSAFIASLINLLEQNGVLVEVEAGKAGKNFTQNGSEYAYHIITKVKEADEYLPVQSIVKMFSPGWYRRANFSQIAACAQVLGHEVSSSLGSPYEWGKCWDSSGDSLIIYSVPSHDEQNNIMESLMKFVGEDKV